MAGLEDSPCPTSGFLSLPQTHLTGFTDSLTTPSNRTVKDYALAFEGTMVTTHWILTEVIVSGGPGEMRCTCL